MGITLNSLILTRVCAASFYDYLSDSSLLALILFVFKSQPSSFLAFQCASARKLGSSAGLPSSPVRRRTRWLDQTAKASFGWG
jgi:hypothetical protein